MVGATCERSKWKVRPVAEVFYEGKAASGLVGLSSLVCDKLSIAYRHALTKEHPVLTSAPAQLKQSEGIERKG
jgi:hypothetical protein